MKKPNEQDFQRGEEARRERNWEPSVRWRVLQDTITWAESQATVQRNTKQARLTEQQRKLARYGLKESPASQLTE